VNLSSGVGRLERKLAAIFYADVAGYSRLTGADEEGTHRRLSACLDAMTASVEAHSGKVMHLAGDALLADFSTVLDALTCAVAIQRDFNARNANLPEERKLRFRIGINLGDVIVDRNEIYGDGVNVAARLEALADAGGICIAGSVYDTIGARLPLSYEYMGAQWVKNIATPVRAYRVLLDSVRTPALALAAKRRRVRITVTITAVAVLVAGFMGTHTLVQRASPHLARMMQQQGSSVVAPVLPAAAPAPRSRARPKLPDKPSIAVLPFDNLSGDPQQDYLADGITEDITTELSKFRDLFVIARNSVLIYKGKATPLQEVGADLGVRYVLTGSVRAEDDKLRINAQLIDATNGRELWAEHFDRTMSDIFALQDEVTQRIVAALAIEVSAAERDRALHKRTSSYQAYDYVLRGRELVLRLSKGTNAQAREVYRKAIRLDGNYARAYSDLATTYLNDWRFGWNLNRKQTLDQALASAQRAVALDDLDSNAHATLGDVYLWTKQYDQAVAEYQRAIALNPNDADGYAGLAGVLTWAGQPQKAMADIDRAMRLNPNYPPMYLWNLGHAYFAMQRYGQAVDAFKELRDRNPNFALTYAYLAVSYEQLGQAQAARAVAEEAKKLSPNWSDARLRGFLPYKNETDMGRVLAGLRTVGLLQ
jgi:adenylate cyclase